MREWVERSALGLMTTDGLALAKIADEIQLPGAHFHLEDQKLKMSFDYHLRPGVVQESNALELMRSVGLESCLPMRLFPCCSSGTRAP